jgi:hypothetical protein
MTIDTNILDTLHSSGITRRRELIRKLQEGTPSEKPQSPITINRHIAQLKKHGSILAIERKQFEDYGITDPDKNAVYYVLKNEDERRQFIDKILPLLTSNDDGDIIATLDEIDRYRGEYHLNSKQLTQVIVALESTNVRIVEKALWIIFFYVNNLKILPSDIDLLKKSLKTILLRFCHEEIISPTIHHQTLLILGILKDPEVVEQLMDDARNLGRLNQVSGRYREPLLAEVIESQRITLFEFERKLRKSSPDPLSDNSKIADIISEIRSQAAFKVLTPSDNNW